MCLTFGVHYSYEKQTAEEADWLIGKDYVRGLPEEVQALRSLKEPGKAYKFSERDKDPQVNHMSKYNYSGDVHINSGIPNKAFYNFAMKFPKLHSWEVAGLIWYRALSLSQPNTTFQEFAKRTFEVIDQCRLPNSLKPSDIKVHLCYSWHAVGINLLHISMEHIGELLPTEKETTKPYHATSGKRLEHSISSSDSSENESSPLIPHKPKRQEPNSARCSNSCIIV